MGEEGKCFYYKKRVLGKNSEEEHYLTEMEEEDLTKGTLNEQF